MEKNRVWSRDWEHFDWEAVRRRLPEAEKSKAQGKGFDIGMSKEELVEYLDWLYENRPEEFLNFIIFRAIMECMPPVGDDRAAPGRDG